MRTCARAPESEPANSSLLVTTRHFGGRDDRAPILRRGIAGIAVRPGRARLTATATTRTVQAREKNSRAIKTLAITSKTGRLRRKAPPHAIERQTEEWRQASGSWPEAIEAPGHASTRAGLGSCTRTGIGRQVRSRRCPAANRRRPEGPGQRARRRGQGAPNWPPEACRRRRDDDRDPVRQQATEILQRRRLQ
jgi:hypothetical protein